jgi:dihydroneopterin aldolase
LETVAQHIADRLKLTFKDMSRYEILIWKEQPPLGMLGGKSSVSLIESMGN